MSKFRFYTAVPNVTGEQWLELNARLQRGELGKLILDEDTAYYQCTSKNKTYEEIAETINVQPVQAEVLVPSRFVWNCLIG